MNYYDRIATLLLSEAKVKPEVLARVKKIQKARRDEKSGKRRINRGGPPPTQETQKDAERRREMSRHHHLRQDGPSISNQ
jgi:hypothetical protein